MHCGFPCFREYLISAKICHFGLIAFMFGVLLSISEVCSSGHPGLRLGLTVTRDPKGQIASAGKLPFSKRKLYILEYRILLLSDAWLLLLIQQHG